MERTIDRRLKEYQKASRGENPKDEQGKARDQSVLDAWSARASKYSHHDKHVHSGQIPGVSNNRVSSNGSYMPGVRGST